MPEKLDVRDTGLRLRRLLAMVAWLATHGTATLEELATRFSLSEADVERELLLVSMCGLPPYSPDQLIDILVIDGVVEARVPEYFHRPRQLTASDGLALLTAGRTLLAVPGADASGPLASALGKLSAALGGADGEGVAVELDAPALLEALQEATEQRAQQEITYYSAASDATSIRVVDPISVFNDGGHWYLAAHCHSVAKDLTFRVDRVETTTATGTTSPKPTKATLAGLAERRGPLRPVAGPDTESVTISVGRQGRWVADSFPVDSVEELKGGRLRVTLTIAGDAFLERLLLRLGPDAVVAKPVGRKKTQQEAARRVLARYR